VTCLVALGTHRPLGHDELELLVGVDLDDGCRDAQGVRVVNHVWDAKRDLVDCGEVDSSTMAQLSAGRIHKAVPVRCNRAVPDHDLVIVLGPVFPHEVTGFSGGNKYLFPGISGPEMIDASHWLGALITSRSIIGVRGTTPVRAMIDLAASMVPTERRCLAFVVLPEHDPVRTTERSGATGARVERASCNDHVARLCGFYAGTCEAAWGRAAQLSAEVHIQRVDRARARAIAVLPEIYEDIWTAAKGMYKLEPIIADGGEVVLYAPHISEFSLVHGALLDRIGYHCRDYFLGQWERFSDIPGRILAHSSHLRGEGSYDPASGVERCRIAVTLATGIGRERCSAMSLGYVDPASIDLSDPTDCETLVVQRAGETLYRLASEL
jgi:nickel-dependent lactate racemase